jgi:hypothetical protein
MTNYDEQWCRQLDKIKSYPIVDYANILGLEPQRIGKKYYTLKHHDSVRINPLTNTFIRNSNGAHGDIIDFARHFENKNFDEAFRDLSRLVGEESPNPSTYSSYRPIAAEKEKLSGRKLELPTPDIASKNRNVYAYLIKTRGIDKGVVDMMIRNRHLYQDTHRNCVFVSYNEEGQADFACQRGTNTHKRFVADVRGCNYDNCFYLDNHADTMIVTESVIDSMSVMTVMQQYGRDLGRYNYLALSGTQKYAAVRGWLERRPEIKSVVLAVDNDQGGLSAVADIWNDLDQMGWQGKRIEYLPPTQKDWNAELVAMQDPPTDQMATTTGWEQTDEVEL